MLSNFIEYLMTLGLHSELTLDLKGWDFMSQDSSLMKVLYFP